jgi:hypothetical protein
MSEAPPPDPLRFSRSTEPPAAPPLNEGTPPVTPSAPIYTYSSSPGVTLIVDLIIPPFPPIPK